MWYDHDHRAESLFLHRSNQHRPTICVVKDCVQVIQSYLRPAGFPCSASNAHLPCHDGRLKRVKQVQHSREPQAFGMLHRSPHFYHFDTRFHLNTLFATFVSKSWDFLGPDEPHAAVSMIYGAKVTFIDYSNGRRLRGDHLLEPGLMITHKGRRSLAKGVAKVMLLHASR